MFLQAVNLLLSCNQNTPQTFLDACHLCVPVDVCQDYCLHSVPRNLFPNNETWKESKIFLINDKLMHKKRFGYMETNSVNVMWFC